MVPTILALPVEKMLHEKKFGKSFTQARFGLICHKAFFRKPNHKPC